MSVLYGKYDSDRRKEEESNAELGNTKNTTTQKKEKSIKKKRPRRKQMSDDMFDMFVLCITLQRIKAGRALKQTSGEFQTVLWWEVVLFCFFFWNAEPRP